MRSPPDAAALPKMTKLFVAEQRAKGLEDAKVIGLAPETPFPNISKLKRFVCSACGSRRDDVSPEWRGHKAAGPCRKRPIGGNFRSDRGPSGDTGFGATKTSLARAPPSLLELRLDRLKTKVRVQKARGKKR